MERTLIDLAQKYAHNRKAVTAPDILAVIERESFGQPIFNGSEPLFKSNVAAASKITGLTPAEILKAVTINSGPYQGKYSKFRCEPGYWQWSNALKSFSPADKFLLSCSFGVGQKMARWLVTGVPQGEWMTVVRQFMSGLPTQVMYVAGDLDSLLIGAERDRALAYTRYNAGPGAKHSTEYGHDVLKRYQRLSAELKNDTV